MIDTTITIGNLLTIIGFLGGGWVFVAALKTDTRLLSQRLSAVETGVEQIATLVTAAARQEERMRSLDRRINELPCRRAPDHCPNT